jgi:hypothetical protein
MQYSGVISARANAGLNNVTAHDRGRNRTANLVTVSESLKVERDLEDLENRSFDHRSMLKEAFEAKKKRVDNVNAFIVVVRHAQIYHWTFTL